MCWIPPVIVNYVYALAIVFVLALGGLVFYNNRKSTSTRLFFALTIVTAAWLLFNLLSWVRPLEIVWSQLSIVGALIPVVFYYFLLSFQKGDSLWQKWQCALLIGATTPFVLFAGTRFNVAGIDTNDPNCPVALGPLYYYIILVAVLFTVLSIVFAYRSWRTSTDTNYRRSLKVVLYGFVIFVLWSLFTNVGAPLFHYDIISMYSPLGVLIFVAVVGYAVVKYQFLNIDLILTQLLTVILWIIIALDLIFAEDVSQKALSGVTLVLTIVFGIVLIRSAQRDFERKKELQEMADRLAFANQELRRLDNAKSEFISIASHQLRTPLTAVKGYVSLLLEGTYGKISTEIEDVLNKVYTANSRLIELVDNLLHISRIESGRMQYTFQSEDLLSIVEDLRDTFTVIAKKKHIALRFDFPSEPLPPISLDRMKIREVISNLIDNAIKYTDHGSVSVSVYQADKGTVRVAVKDTGAGVRPEDKERLFTKFTRSQDTERMHVGGTGLGLYVGRTFANRHGGKLYVESAGVSQGAEFVLELPLVPPNPTDLPNV